MRGLFSLSMPRHRAPLTPAHPCRWDPAVGLRQIVVEIATCSAASSLNVRSAALILMCHLTEKAGSTLAADGVAVAALLAASEGEHAVLSGDLRQRCAAAHERLETLAEDPHTTSPLRLRPRYSSLDLPVSWGGVTKES